MGVLSIVSGRILMRGSIEEKTRLFIQSLNNDTVFPWIRSNMFSIGSTEESPYFYESVIGFAATYKAVEDDWDEFTRKFEYILENLDFYNAKIQLETEYYGTFHFFWQAKTGANHFAPKEQFRETDKWFFGYGYRNQFGLLEETLEQKHIFPNF
ncbi:MAG: hypothetical protein MUE81_16715 [Thermoflexibacter sp.]|jgi:hypothetical protein|nr:hypothetical protein [Thermoflexibacter sp.]